MSVCLCVCMCVVQRGGKANPPPMCLTRSHQPHAYHSCLRYADWKPIGKEAGKLKMSITAEDM